MKQLCYVLFFSIFMCMSLLGTVVAMGDQEQYNDYYLNISVDTTNYLIEGNESIIYYNNSNDVLNEIYFYLYANAFKELDTAPIFTYVETAYPNGFDEGHITVSVPEYNFEIKDDIFLKIELSSPLQPKESIAIAIDFVIKIPETLNRFGHYNDIIYAANCFPIASVYENGAWTLYPYTSMGDPFYSSTGNWHASINIANSYKIASTGREVEQIDKGDTTTFIFEAPMSRDFAFACSNQYEVAQKEHNDVVVQSFYLKEDLVGGLRALDISIQALDLYESIFGKYPYETLTIAETFLGGAAGMEYPQLIFVDKFYYDDAYGIFFEIIVAHEIAHQWWYAVVGNNEVTEPFIDEGLAQYSTALYFERYYEDGRDIYFESYIKEPYSKARLQGIGDIACRPLFEFASNREYYIMTYLKGPIILDTLRWYLGAEEFASALSKIYNEYMYDIISIEEFKSSLENSTNDHNIGALFDMLTKTSVFPDVAIGTATISDSEIHIVPKSTGVPLPVEVEIKFEDGTTLLLEKSLSFNISTTVLPVSYTLDPNDHLFEENETNNTGTFLYLQNNTSFTEQYKYWIMMLFGAIVAVAVIIKRRNIL